ncbi:MAG TPA: toll/interleukin-1 receptor domain-containing protein [Thermoanaerobaculia bacterium]|nr:toll/interleukin-1 receptor domain-containing protein [Thermoanaerobaculia bacterium]
MTSPGPRVFISYADPDDAFARRLVSDLTVRGIETFFAPKDVQPGETIPVHLSRGLEQSDYFVLLVSAHSVGRRWVEEEWSTALFREINERRAFLFLLRLDETVPPGILAARRYLDAFRDWNKAVERLIETWERDWQSRQRAVDVLPAPGLPDSPQDAEWGLYIFNTSLSVEHFLRTSPRLSCRQLQARVRTSLQLQDTVSILDGKLGMRFSYSLLRKGFPLEPELHLIEAGIEEDSVLDLLVKAEPFGPNLLVQPVVFRAPAGGPSLTEAVQRDLLLKAFGHLLPWPSRRRGAAP